MNPSTTLFERQESPEGKWVKVLDRFLPFILNFATQGKTWKVHRRKSLQDC